MGERLRSPVYYLSRALMAVVVASAIVLPSLLDIGADTQHIGMAGSSPTGLGQAVDPRCDAVGVDAQIRRFDSVSQGERAVRDGDLDVLVVDADRLAWLGRTDAQPQTILTSAMQVTIQQRATATGLSPAELASLVAPVAVDNVESGRVAGRSDDETASYLRARGPGWRN